MGVSYHIFPMDEDVREWLESDYGQKPNSFGSAPTPHQLVIALKSLSDQLVEFNIRPGVWQATISDRIAPETGPWAALSVLGYEGEESDDEPCEFYFQKGFPSLIVKIVHRISQCCGSFAIVPDTGCPPAIVEADSDPEEILANWKHIMG
jgi:hypothetical protein